MAKIARETLAAAWLVAAATALVGCSSTSTNEAAGGASSGGAAGASTRGTQSGAACTKDLQCPPGELCDGTCRVPCELGTDAGCECEVVSPVLPWGLCK